MNQKKHFDWCEAKRLFEVGMPVTEIAAAVGTTRKTIHLHIRSEGWQRPARPEPETIVAGSSDIRDPSELSEPVTPDVMIDWNDLHNLHRKAVRLAGAGDFGRAAAVGRLLHNLADSLHAITAGLEKSGQLVPVELLDDEQLEREINKLQQRIAEKRGDSTLQ